MVEHYTGRANRSDQLRGLYAREAAEALFKSKPLVKLPQTGTAAPDTKPGQHKPRILAAAPNGAAPKQEPVSAVPENASPATLDEEIAKIRTWIKYGMTVAEVAHVYGISAAEVKRALDAR